MTHPHVLAATAQPEYEFLIDQRDGRYFLLLVDQEMKAAGRFTPLHVLVAETRPQLEALCGWLQERRDQ